MNELVEKLKYIADDCGMPYQEPQKEESEPELDESEKTPFNIKRREMNIKLKEVRKCIEERAEMESKSDCDKVEVVKISQEIRNRIKDIEELAEEMNVIYKKDLDKNKKKVCLFIV